MSSSNNQVEDIFGAAVLETNPGSRRALLERACAGDTELRSRVEALLQAHEQAGSFLEPLVAPPDETVATIRSKSAVAEAPGKTVGPYKLIERLGEGGFGVVYLAEQIKPVRRQVALKILKLGMDTESVMARFEAERQVLAMMDHPSIARVYDAGATDTGRPYFVMELVKGIPITNYCEENRLTLRERLDLLVMVCDAVQYAHQKGVIHRDIKPSNLLVTLQGTLTVPKIIDFGVAKAAAQHVAERTMHTSLGELVGTPVYMSPDQTSISGMDVDTRTDIYSLGVLLYELMVGRTPFDAHALRQVGYDEMCRIIREVDPAWPSLRAAHLGEDLRDIAWRRRMEPAALAKSLRGDLDWIVIKAMDKDRVRRYQTATELAADIRRHLSDQPVLAGPPGAGYRLSKFVRRNRAAVAAAALVLVALLAGSTLATLGLLDARRANTALATQVARSQATSEFLQSMLASVDPSRALGRQVTVRYVLDEAAQSVSAGSLSKQPGVEASIRETLGRTYQALGDYDSAFAHLSKAGEINASLLGERHPDALHCQSLLADLSNAMSRHAEAEVLARKTLEAQVAVLGAEHPETLATQNHLSVALAEQNRLAEAEELQRATLGVQRRLLGADHVDTLRSIVHLGSILLARGENQQAEELLRDAMDRCRRALGEEHPDTMVAMNQLALSLHRQQKYAAAEGFYRRSWETNRRVLGADHPMTQIPFNNLMRVLKQQGKLEALRPLVAERLERLKRAAGSPDADALALNAYAWELITCEPKDLRDPVAALPVARRAVELSRGEDSNFLDTLARAQRMNGLLAEAVATQRQAVELAKAGGPYNLTELEERLSEYQLASGDPLGAAGISWQTFASPIRESFLPATEPGKPDADRAAQYLERGQFTLAEETLEGCLAARLKDLPADHWLVGETRSLLGEAIAGQNRFEEAESLLIEGYSVMAGDARSPRERKEAALHRILRLYGRWQKPEEADKWAEKVVREARPPSPGD